MTMLNVPETAVRLPPGLVPGANDEPLAADRDFQELFTENPLPVWLVDPVTAKFIDVNPAAIRKYGYTRGEFLTMTMRDLSPAGESRAYHAPRLPANVSSVSSGWRHAVKSGDVIWVNLYTWLFPYQGRAVRFVLVHDVTDLNKAAELLLDHSNYMARMLRNPSEPLFGVSRVARKGDFPI
jgi:PAS domain S-box-containing protein